MTSRVKDLEESRTVACNGKFQMNMDGCLKISSPPSPLPLAGGVSGPGLRYGTIVP
ncbi:hypothetical protein CH063_15416 [Colletotrichum higginsianum]|uniref:Uncharacterized protein n=1 Tax=Colletotrichum higginsianum (strain IMI 349063) TaxID=759273 RepID=H1W2Q0_COLHI|nr:hypothetical protein CH063_15416 [Colletotrichum higginsianum]